MKRKINKTKLMYSVIRAMMFLLLVVNVVGFFIDKDDSQKSRDMFNAFQSFLMLLCTYVPGFIERTGKVSVPNVMSVVFICFWKRQFSYSVNDFYIINSHFIQKTV